MQFWILSLINKLGKIINWNQDWPKLSYFCPSWTAKQSNNMFSVFSSFIKLELHLVGFDDWGCSKFAFFYFFRQHQIFPDLV